MESCYKLEKGLSIAKYKGDILNRITCIVLPNTMTIGEVIDHAITHNCQIIIQTFPYGNKPGVWYVKASKENYDYSFLKDLLVNASEKKQQNRSNAYLLKY